MAQKQQQYNADKLKPTTVDFITLMKMGLTRQAEWADQELFLDFIYWSRQIVAVLLGLIWGFIPLTGFLGLALFGLFNSVYVYFYAINFQQVDEEAYGGIWEIIKEGFMTCFASFVVTWIITYSSVHWNDLLLEKY